DLCGPVDKQTPPSSVITGVRFLRALRRLRLLSADWLFGTRGRTLNVNAGPRPIRRSASHCPTSSTYGALPGLGGVLVRGRAGATAWWILPMCLAICAVAARCRRLTRAGYGRRPGLGCHLPGEGQGINGEPG